MSDSRHYAAMPSGHRTPVDEQRDPTVVASGLLVGLLMLGLVGGLASIMGAHWGYVIAFAVMAVVSGTVLWWVRRPSR